MSDSTITTPQELHIPNGTPLGVACRSACELADEYGVVVYFNFNDLEVECQPGMTEEQAVEQYRTKKGEKE